VGPVGVGATSQVALERFEHLFCDGFETAAAFEIGAHCWYLSGSVLILSQILR